MLTRAKKIWDIKLASIFRDARGRAGSITAFILTLKGVYQVPMRTVGGALASITAALPLLFFLTKIKKNYTESSETDNAVVANPISCLSTQIIQQKIESDKNNCIIKYIDSCIAFMGQFGTHHMEMMIVSATIGFEFIDYEVITNPKNFAMLAYMTFAFYHSVQVFLETKKSYEQESKLVQMRDFSVQVELSILHSTLFRKMSSLTHQFPVEIKIDQMTDSKIVNYPTNLTVDKLSSIKESIKI